MVVLKKTLKSIDTLAQNINRNVQPLAEDTSKTLLKAQTTLREAASGKPGFSPGLQPECCPGRDHECSTVDTDIR